MIKEFLKKYDFFLNIYEYLHERQYRYFHKISDRYAAEKFFEHCHGFKPNLDNPSHLEEKIIWMALNTDTTLWTKCTDKYAVREYVEEKGAGNTLNKLYGKWDTAESIDFNKLPNQYVIKTNQGCGSVLVVKDNSKVKIEEERKKLHKWLKYKYGAIGYNMHYSRIKPCVIAEKYLDDGSPNGVPIDYKCFCFDGDVECIAIYGEREFKSHKYKVKVYDKEWNPKDVLIDLESAKEYTKPLAIKDLIDSCKKLGKGIPFCRIDFYIVKDHVIFGEMTFTPEILVFNNDYCKYMGSLVDLSKLHTK